jgi:hypothetical protein
MVAEGAGVAWTGGDVGGEVGSGVGSSPNRGTRGIAQRVQAKSSKLTTPTTTTRASQPRGVMRAPRERRSRETLYCFDRDIMNLLDLDLGRTPSSGVRERGRVG